MHTHNYHTHNACIHAHTYPCTHIGMHTHMHAHTYTCTHTCMHTHMHAHTYTCTHRESSTLEKMILQPPLPKGNQTHDLPVTSWQHLFHRQKPTKQHLFYRQKPTSQHVFHGQTPTNLSGFVRCSAVAATLYLSNSSNMRIFPLESMTHAPMMIWLVSLCSSRLAYVDLWSAIFVI